MKKSLLALAILGSVAGAANAASSVTMYGRVDVGYQKVTGTSTTQEGAGETRFGIKGSEDLGNGLAATFQLEGRFDADVGAKTAGTDFFDRESTVGLKGSFGHVRFGRSVSAMDRALGGYAPGERVATTYDPYSSATRHSNSMFYDFERSGFNMGFNVATKGGAVPSTQRTISNPYGNPVYLNEGDAGEVGYGVHAGYAIGGFRVNAAYQADKNGTGAALDFTPATGRINDLSSLTFGADKEWGVGMAYKFKMIEVGGTYAEAKADEELSTFSQKLKTWGGYITADVTANDSVYVRYLEKRLSADFDDATFSDAKIKVIAGGYKHDLSKRTSVYFDVARYSTNAPGVDSSNQYDIAMRHSF
jgi:general bacterial porin, GBP family